MAGRGEWVVSVECGIDVRLVRSHGAQHSGSQVVRRWFAGWLGVGVQWLRYRNRLRGWSVNRSAAQNGQKLDTEKPKDL